MDEKLINKMLSYMKKNESVPLLTLIRISPKCNAKCFMCESWKKPHQSVKIQTLFELIDNLYSLGGVEVRITGGEPTLNPNLIELSERIRNNDLHLSLITNGSGNANLMKRMIEIGTKRIYISLDSPYAEVHDKLRGAKGLFNNVMKTIDTINYTKKENGLKSEITVNMVVSKFNFEHITDMVKLCFDRSVEEINPIPIKGVPSACLSKDQIKIYNYHIVPKLKNMLKMYGIKIRYEDLYIFGNDDLQIEESSKGMYTRRFYNVNPCWVTMYSSFVDEYGDIYPCSNTPYIDKEFAIGNINKDTFPKIWNSRVAFTRRLLSKSGQLEKCIGCDGTNVRSNKIVYQSLIL